MFHRSVVGAAIALGVLVLALPGQAQPRGAQPPVEVLPPATPQGGGETPAAPPEGEKKRPVTPAAGYAYGDKRGGATASAAPRSRYRARGPVVNMPGFEQTADGGSRLFVQLTQNVPVEERKAQGSITYGLKGASPRVRNNTNALVTVHFNTPVSRARLVPHGQDLHFIVELRGAATPTWKVTDAQDKSALLSIEFPKGDYLQVGGEGPEAASTPRAPQAPRKRGGAKNTPPVKAEAPPADGPKP